MSEPANPAPLRLRPAQGDHTAALALFGGILAALRLVDATGEGQVVDVSLLGAAAWTMSSDLSATLIDGVRPTPQGRIARPHALHGGFRCADGRWVLLFMPEPHWWPRFCEAVGRPEWVEDERFATYAARAANMPELTRLMDEVIATRPLREWCAVFDERGFIWGPASTVDEFADDEQAAADGLFPEIEGRADGGSAPCARRCGCRVPTSHRAAPRRRSASTPPRCSGSSASTPARWPSSPPRGSSGPRRPDRPLVVLLAAGEERGEPGRTAERLPALTGLGEPVGDQPEHRRVDPHAEVARPHRDVLAARSGLLQAGPPVDHAVPPRVDRRARHPQRPGEAVARTASESRRTECRGA